MGYNPKRSSAAVASLAAQVLQDGNSSGVQRRLAGSVLSQTNTGNQTGAELEGLASRVLQSEKYNDLTQALAGSVLSQSNKAR
ncbi:hypothetical protein [Desulfovibrio aminophilus]|uniref:hypothetical protein n=1 Tax=Desulfovibrio aminophilus TaxID=81425 RepID=UPI00040E2D19|nr:hypothetical protein [Desulfovibrio aminophilus]